MNRDHIEKIRNYVSHIQLSLLLQFALICALVVLGTYVFVDEELETVHISVESTSPPLSDPFSDLDLDAEAVCVFDVENNKIIFAKNEKNVYPLASITKIATALTAYKIAATNTPVSITPESINIDGDNGLLVEEKWKLSDLLDFTLLVSSNDGAHQIASVAGVLIDKDRAVDSFVDEMNKLASDIGLEKTRFYNPSGLDIDNNRSGGYGTAEDVAMLMSYAIVHYPELLEGTKFLEATFVSLDNIIHHATNTNPSVADIPGLLASKTGYTNQSGGNLVIVFDPFPGKPIVIAVLGSTYDGRFTDVDKLSKATMTFIRQEN